MSKAKSVWVTKFKTPDNVPASETDGMRNPTVDSKDSHYCNRSCFALDFPQLSGMWGTKDMPQKLRLCQKRG